ncbi:conserved hypothetical protein [Virus Rctr71]|nr:conserved hypothetical protein [Virus Rctr71]
MKAELWPYDDRRIEVPVKENPLWWQKQGLQYTASGYGKKIPASYMVNHNQRWYRVYCTIYSNIGSLYILSKGERISVDIRRE